MTAMENAADWLDRQDGLSPAEQIEFRTWLYASELNAQTFVRMQRAMGDAALRDAAAYFRSASTPLKRTPKLRAENPQAGLGRWLERLSATSRWGMVGLSAAVLASVAVLTIIALPQLHPDASPRPLAKDQEYATAVGVRSDSLLTDKSLLHLNADSKVLVNFSSRERGVRLDRGEAMFDVTHDPTRPFNVAAGGAMVTAVGTTFDVDLLEDAVEVRVYKGVVKVASPKGTLSLVRKGEWLILASDRGQAVGRFVPDLTQSWRSDWLQADNMPLKYVVDRLNRYSKEKIFLKSGALSDVSLTGRFDLSQTDRTLAMMSTLLNLNVDRSGRQIHLSRK